MMGAEAKLGFGRSIGAEFIGHHHRRCKPLLLEELTQQSFCSPSISTTLNQEIQHFTFAVDGASKIELPTSHHDYHFVKEPMIGWSMTGLSNALSINWTKFEEPPAYGLVRDVQAPLG